MDDKLGYELIMDLHIYKIKSESNSYIIARVRLEIVCNVIDSDIFII